MDYAFPQKRKSKRDKKAKASYNKYKVGGRHRSSNVVLRESEKARKEKRKN